MHHKLVQCMRVTLLQEKAAMPAQNALDPSDVHTLADQVCSRANACVTVHH